MIITKLKQNSYQDSINLMLLTNSVNTVDGVKSAQVMMGTDANKDIFKTSGLYNEDVEKANPNDMVIAVDADDESVMDTVMKEVDSFLKDLSTKKDTNQVHNVNSWDEAEEALSDANMALISIPGMYAADEIERALDKGLHAFVFSDNVSMEDEVRLKKKAHEKGLLVMGPDAGTGLISSVPMAFTNVIRPGNIALAGASGTGIQEVSTIIDRLGGGVVNAIGTGGRDLSEEVDAITMMDTLVALDQLDDVDVITVISKPPAKAVRDKVASLLQNLSKPVVAIFLGEKPESHEGNVYYAYTLEEAARMSVDLANGNEVKETYQEPLRNADTDVKVAEDKTVKGLYSGGTLASEAATLIAEALNLGELSHEEGYKLKTNGFEVMDLGDDMYTQGKPHPMIDPEVRINKIKQYAADDNTGVILLDVVLGYGSHPDMANALKPAIEEAKKENTDLQFVATIVGTDNDPQDYDETRKVLEEIGVLVEDSNAKAVRLALHLMGHDLAEAPKTKVDYKGEKMDVPKASEKVLELLTTKPRVINVGVESFSEVINDHGGKAVQYDWRPRAGGDKRMIRILNELDKISDEIEEENARVIQRYKDAQPFLTDVVLAKDVFPELGEEKIILHAGPPLAWEHFTGPARGAVYGAIMYEGWADNEEDAKKLAASGEIRFEPCHHWDAVGPMGGITTGSMPWLVVENRATGNKGYCTINEGIGKVARFGAYDQSVIDRFNWMEKSLAPILSKALKQIEGGLNLNVIMAKSIGMGDEFHQRNHAASLNFLKEMAPLITAMEDVPLEEREQAIQFLADTDQFYLNIAMATGKAIVDGVRKQAEEGTIVTTMARNGYHFGVRTGQAGDEWFEAPVNTPIGLYFTGFTEEDGNPDIGDSAITETIGVGATAMIAAPAVTRFVGAGGFQDALEISNEMTRIYSDHNPNWTIPTWDFKGSVVGCDIRKVVETGITPIINTGIAHKDPGVGQVGAGTVRAPLGCFQKALVAYAKSKGINVDEE